MNEAMPSVSTPRKLEIFSMASELWMAERSVATWSSESLMVEIDSLVRLVSLSACSSVPSSWERTPSVSFRVGERLASTLLRSPEASENESSAE